MDNEFEEVVVENFGPFVGKHVLRLNDNGALTYVKGRNEVEPALGPNGAGKSKLLNAISWCLYGKTTDDLAATDIRPWHSDKQTIVTVKLITWDGDDGTRHAVKRTAGPNSITIDGKKVLQPAIDRLIGMPFGVFRLAPFLGQGQPLFHDLQNSDKLNFLVGVVGLDRWDAYSDKAKKKADTIDRELQRMIGSIEANNVRIDELATQVARQKAESDTWEAERAGKLAAAEKDVKRLTKEAAKATDALAAIATKLDGAELELKLLNADYTKLRDAANAAELEYQRLVDHNARVEGDIERARAELRLLQESQQCPTCGQVIKRKSDYLANLKRVEEKVREFTADMNVKGRSDAKKKSDAARDKVEAHTVLDKKARDAVSAAAAEERLIRNNSNDYDYQLKNAARVRDELQDGRNPHRDRLAELRRAHKKALDDNDELRRARDAAEAKHERVRFWVKTFKDIRLYVLEDVLTELEFATNAMLDDMGLIGWEVKYAVERETQAGTTKRELVTTVLSPNYDGDVKWKSWSGGEGQRLRLAGALALSDVLLARAGVVCNIEVLDEPTRHLSSEGVDDLIEFLARRARTHKKSIFLVDHMAIESARFDRVVTVIKTKAGSSIKGG